MVFSNKTLLPSTLIATLFLTLTPPKAKADMANWCRQKFGSCVRANATCQPYLCRHRNRANRNRRTRRSVIPRIGNDKASTAIGLAIFGLSLIQQAAREEERLRQLKERQKRGKVITRTLQIKFPERTILNVHQANAAQDYIPTDEEIRAGTKLIGNLISTALNSVFKVPGASKAVTAANEVVEQISGPVSKSLSDKVEESTYQYVKTTNGQAQRARMSKDQLKDYAKKQARQQAEIDRLKKESRNGLMR